MPQTRPKQILLITLEPIANQMAGPAIRTCELGKQLAKHFAVTIFSPYQANHISPTIYNPCQLELGISQKSLLQLAKQQDILIIQANVLKQYPQLANLNKFLVVDLYDPFLFNIHIQYANYPPAIASASFRLMHKLLEKHMLAADFTICASERQRDYWLGRFCALGKINPALHNFDPSLRKLIDVVPFGLPENPPQIKGDGPRSIFAKIQKEDPLLLWAGGIWDWLDPLTVIKAIAILKNKFPNIRLVFMGRKSPNPQVEDMRMSKSAEDLARELNILDENVFFCSDWISYEQRASFLLEANIGVSAHFDLPETRFSFRTRLLDYFWAQLPVLTTTGDELADLVTTSKAGFALNYQDINGWVDTITQLLIDQELQKRCRLGTKELAQRFTWHHAAQALINYCHNPYHPPDHSPVTMPNLIERALCVYQRGGRKLAIERAKQIIKEIISL